MIIISNLLGETKEVQTTKKTLSEAIEDLIQRDEINPGLNLFIFVNQKKITNLDLEINPEDRILVIQTEKGWFAALPLIAKVFIGVTISLALGFVAKYFIPDIQDPQLDTDTVYNINSSNKTRKGAPLPVIYGEARVTPSLIAEPYYVYINNEEYLFQTMCVGNGDLNLSSRGLYVSETPVFSISSSLLKYKVFHEEDYKNGGLNDSYFDSHYYEITKRNPDVDNMELLNTPNQEIQTRIRVFTSFGIGVIQFKFSSEEERDKKLNELQNLTSDITINYQDGNENKIETINKDSILGSEAINTSVYLFISLAGAQSGIQGHTLQTASVKYGSMFISYGPYRFEGKTLHDRTLKLVEIDVTLPQGAYIVDHETGTYDWYVVSIEINVCHYKDGVETKDTYVETLQGKDTSPKRRSFRYVPPNAGQDGLYYIYIIRKTADPDNYYTFGPSYVTRIKGLYGFENFTGMPRMTLLVTQAKASNGLSKIGQFQINGYFKSDKNTLSSAITDIYTNEDYGSGLSPIDIEQIGDVNVNGALTQQQTVFDALTTMCNSNGFVISPQGTKLKIKPDESQPRKALFNETNIIKDSLVFSWNFDKENLSVQSTYFDLSKNWKPLDVVYPENTVNPTIKNNLWGITNKQRAEEMTEMIYKRTLYSTKTVNFDTDLQGYIPEYYDRIGVSHQMTTYAAGGVIKGRGTWDSINKEFISDTTGDYLILDCGYDLPEFSGLCSVMLCDESLDCEKPLCCHNNPPSENNFDTIIFRDQIGNTSDELGFVGISGTRNVIYVENMPNWVQVYENGTWFSIGENTKTVEDYIITKIQPKGDIFTIQGFIYDERIYS